MCALWHISGCCVENGGDGGGLQVEIAEPLVGGTGGLSSWWLWGWRGKDGFGKYSGGCRDWA